MPPDRPSSIAVSVVFRVRAHLQGQPPDLKEPVVMTAGRYGCTVEAFCNHIHRDLVRSFKVRESERASEPS